MKIKPYFFQKIKVKKKIKGRLMQILYGGLRVNSDINVYFCVSAFSTFPSSPK